MDAVAAGPTSSGEPGRPLTPPKLATLLNRSPQTVQRWIKEGAIQAKTVQRGRTKRYEIPPDEVERCIRQYSGRAQEAAQDQLALEAERRGHELTRQERDHLVAELRKAKEACRLLTEALRERSAHRIIELQAEAMQQFVLPDYPPS